MLFYALLDPNFGHRARRHWLGTTTSGAFLGASSFVGGWQFMPFHTLIYQGGARQIPEVLYQAAAIDGAGRCGSSAHITLPQLRNTVATSRC